MTQIALEIAALLVPSLLGVAVGTKLFRVCRTSNRLASNPIVLRSVSAVLSAVAAICLGGTASYVLLVWADKASPPSIGDNGGGIGQMIAWLLSAFLGAIAGLISGTGLGQRTRRR